MSQYNEGAENHGSSQEETALEAAKQHLERDDLHVEVQKSSNTASPNDSQIKPRRGDLQKVEGSRPELADTNLETDDTEGSKADAPVQVPTNSATPGTKKPAPTRLSGRFFKRMSTVALPTLIYAITVYCAFTARYHNSPLGLVSASNGILILHLLSKAGDVALAAAAHSAWTQIQWALASRNPGPTLSTIFALSTSTRTYGLTQILMYCTGSLVNQPKVWSFARLATLLILYGPGTILMSDVNVQDMYWPISFSPISGGMGVFDPQLVHIFEEGSGPYISSLVQSLLRDPATALPVRPINPLCNNSTFSCSSYLLSGGVVSVSPWPFNITSPDESDYIVQNGPSYQIDFWRETSPITWLSTSCHVYGTNAAGLQLCIQNSTDAGTRGQLVSGWRICPTNLTYEGGCNQPDSWDASPIWTTSMSVYRRTATVACSRASWAMLHAENLGSPTPEIIDPSDLFKAFDAILTPAGNQSSDPQCPTPESQLTNYLYIFIDQSSTPINQAINIPLDYLRNLLATPLYLCNKVMLTASDSPSAIEKDLPPENYLLGSYAIQVERAIPAKWSSITYSVLYGQILLVLFVVLITTSVFESPNTSSFPIADLWMSIKAATSERDDGEERTNEPSAVQFHELFTGIKPGDNKAILGRADKVAISWKSRGSE